MTTTSKNKPPAKLVYKGLNYHRVALTDEGNIWKTQVTPRLEQLLEIASDGEVEDQIKKEQAYAVWRELREYFKLLGLQ